MNTSNITTAELNALSQFDFVYMNYDYALVGASVLLFYSILLNLPREIKTIWSSWNSTSLPALLYVFTKYPLLIQQVLIICINLSPSTSTRTCSRLINASNVMSSLSYIGSQGLLISRAYSLCQGGRILTTALFFGFFSVLVIDIIEEIVLPGCQIGINHTSLILYWLQDTFTVAANVLVLSICARKIWIMWKVRRETGLRSYNALIFVFFMQTTFSTLSALVTTIEVQLAVYLNVPTDITADIVYEVVTILAAYQSTLQVIIVADFTLDLRCRNSKRIRESDISLPNLDIRSVLQFVHQSITVELSTPEDINPGLDEDVPAVDDYDGTQP